MAARTTWTLDRNDCRIHQIETPIFLQFISLPMSGWWRALLAALASATAAQQYSDGDASGVRFDPDHAEPPHRFIVWFRNDLRLDDNPLLTAASTHAGPKEVVPVYIFDPRSFNGERMGPHPSRFLLDSVAALRHALRGIGSDLLVGIGEPEKLLPLLVSGVRFT